MFTTTEMGDVSEQADEALTQRARDHKSRVHG